MSISEQQAVSASAAFVELTPMQRQLWASQRRHPGFSHQNTALLSTIDGEVDEHRLASAFEQVVEASDVLRSRIVETPASTLVELRTDPAISAIIPMSRADAVLWAAERVTSPLDMTICGYDSVIIPHGDGTLSWYLNLHHVVTDATASANVFAQTAAAYYELPLEIGSYYGWAASLDSADSKMARALEHWQERTPLARIGRLYQPVGRPSPESHRIPIGLEPDLRKRLDNALAGPYRGLSEDLAWTNLLLTATALYLHRVTGASEMALGLPVHNRSSEEAAALFGPLMQVFPVDVAIKAGDTFASLHKRIARSAMGALRHARAGAAPASPDVEAVVNIISRGGIHEFGPHAVTTDWIHPGATDPNHLVQLQLTTYAGGSPSLVMDVNDGAATTDNQTQISEHLAAVLHSLVDDPTAPVGRCSIITAAERSELSAWGNRRNEAPEQELLPGLIETSLAASVGPALSDANRSLTGPETLAEVRRTTAWLQGRGVEVGDRIAIQMHRSIDTVVAILACWEAGASYVPIDPEQPELRRTSLITRAGCTLVLSDIEGAKSFDGAALSVGTDPEREAYLLFTSGSTGEPKGVPITHLGVADYLHFARTHYLRPSERPVVPLFSALTFDLTVTSLFLPLITGGELVVVEPDGPQGLRQIADTPRLTWMKGTPSHAELLVRMLTDLHRLDAFVLGGEALGSRLVDQLWLINSEMRIFNEYGPTEAVVGCMIHQAQPTDTWSEVPIGIPAPGVELIVVDAYDQLAPIGSPGELLISHRGVTADYLGAQPGTGPFLIANNERFYRSGDLVRFVAPGVLTYLGRLDQQVKVGGIRLDPTEVEHQLEKHPDVQRAAVRLHQPTSGPAFLTAWFEAGVKAPTAAELRPWLAERVPSHAVPAAYVEVAALPTTTNGKLDTRSLPAPTTQDRTGAASDEMGITALERVIIDIWITALGTAAIGPHDAFFDVGGDSLAAMQSVMALGHRLERALPEELIFEYRTPRELAAAVASFDHRDQQAGNGRTALGEDVSQIPLTPGEASMLFEWLNDPHSSQNNVGVAYQVCESVDPDRLREAAELLIERHLTLQLTMVEPRRRLTPAEALTFTVEPAGDKVEFETAATQLFNEPHDLQNGPLLRLLLKPLTTGGSGLVLAIHHALIDEAGLATLFTDLDHLYAGKLLPPLSVAYPEWIASQIEQSTDEADRQFFLAPQRSGKATLLRFPAASGTDGYIERVCSSPARNLDRFPGTSRAAVSLAALAKTLRPYATSDELQIGMPISTRSAANSDLAGYSLNTLPLTVSVSEETSVDAAATIASAELRSVMQHRHYPFASLVRDRRKADLPVPGLRTLLAFSNLPPTRFGGQPARHRVLAPSDATTDLTFFVQVRDQEVTVAAEYSGSVLDAATIEELLERFEKILFDDASNKPDSIAAPVLVPAPIPAATESWEAEPLRSPIPAQLLHEIVAEQARLHPDAVAVTSPNVTISYRQLDQQANAVAHQILEGGTVPGSSVGVITTRRPELVAGILGVLKAGCAYVPIDPDYPETRITSIVVDSAIELVVAAGLVPPSLSGLDSLDITNVEARQDAPRLETKVDDVAYTIFTSGSTGRPKGVAVSHANISFSTLVRSQVYDHDPASFLLLSSFAFDSSMVGLWWTLCNGGELVLPEPGMHTDVHHLAELVERRSVTHLLALPTLYAVLISEIDASKLGSLNTVMVAGEACTPNLITSHFATLPNAQLHNEYGPTEATVWSHHHQFPTTYSVDQPVPIGRPIPGTICRVLDLDGSSLPAGRAGELYVGGPGITGGYIGQPARTAERFAIKETSVGPVRMYRTGDLVRWLETGELEFVGRADDQVKIRGFRVELGEIESALGTHPAVRVVAVRTVPTPTGERLAAWFVAAPGCSATAVDLREHLSNLVPGYMVPSYFTPVEQMPVTPNGKIDRAALPDPQDRTSPSVENGPVSTTELAPIQATIRSIWSEVLGDQNIGLTDNYFDLGGDSILSIRIVAGLRRNGIQVKPRDLFDSPTIAELALVAAQDDDAADILTHRPEGTVPLLPMQQWFFDQDFADPDHWNQSMWVESAERLEPALLSQAFDAVLSHHDALRSRFTRSNDGWEQTIEAEAPPVFVQEFRNLADDAIEVVARSVEAGLRISSGELVGAAIFRGRNQPDRLFLTVHHLVMDGVSWRPLIEDLSTAYQSVASDTEVAFPARTSSVAHWADVLDQLPASPHWSSFRLPAVDEQRRPETAGTRFTVSVDSGAIDGVLDRLLTAVAQAHRDVFGWDRFTATLEGHGRADDVSDAIDLSRTVGWFTSLYPVDVIVDPSVGTALATARSEAPYGGVGALAVIGDRLPRMVVNYLGRADRSVAGTDLFTPTSGIEAGYGSANHRTHDLGIIAYASDGQLHVSWDYVPEDYSTEVIEMASQRFIEHFDPTATRTDLLDFSPTDLSRLEELLTAT